MAQGTESKQPKRSHGKVAYKVSGGTTTMRNVDDEAENRAKLRAKAKADETTPCIRRPAFLFHASRLVAAPAPASANRPAVINVRTRLPDVAP